MVLRLNWSKVHLSGRRWEQVTMQARFPAPPAVNSSAIYWSGTPASQFDLVRIGTGLLQFIVTKRRIVAELNWCEIHQWQSETGERKEPLKLLINYRYVEK